jgi:hypothetical protein
MGSAYIFLGLDKEWVQERKTLASDGVADDRYGVATSISGKTAVIGAYFDDARRVQPTFSSGIRVVLTTGVKCGD